MKISLIFLVMILIIQSCQTKNEQSNELKLFFKSCDELNIVYYTKDTFVFKTIDTATIRNFTELIFGVNEDLTDTCETAEKLIYKSKGNQILTADISMYNRKDGIDYNYIMYFFNSKMYRYRLTYRTGMGIDEIYWHKVDPQRNPWTGIDSSTFHYEEIKDNP